MKNDMDFSIGIALAALVFSGAGVVFVIITLRQTVGRDSVDLIKIEMEAFKIALDKCRSEYMQADLENRRLREENFQLYRRLAEHDNR